MMIRRENPVDRSISPLVILEITYICTTNLERQYRSHFLDKGILKFLATLCVQMYKIFKIVVMKNITSIHVYELALIQLG